MEIGADNRRILVIDDTEGIHGDFRKILGSNSASGADAALAAAEAALFSEVVAVSQEFQIESAYQGREGAAMVARAVAEDKPYAMAFVDMRMPPGWDGVETVEHLWREDPRMQIALCTAYSDYSWDTITERLGVDDRLLILKKPFDPIEIRQMASALTMKWRATQEAAFKMSTLESAVEERTKELSDANMIVQNSPTILYRLRGEPALPLIYISHNITKFGHDPKALIESPAWGRSLVDPQDRDRVDAAMARVLEKGASASSIEFRLRTGDGSYRWVENRYLPVRDKADQLVEIEEIIIDITERKAAEEKIAHLARTDGLTGLANRATFMERLRQAFAAAERGAIPFAIFYLDLDHFKPVNDTLGHPAGDQLLRMVADRLLSCTRETDLVARLGGDEFAVLQGEMTEPSNAAVLAAKIQRELALPYALGGNEAHISVSIGISPYAPDITTPDVMLAQADLALYRSKEEGRNRYHFHSDDLDKNVLDHVTLAEELRKAIAGSELELYFQPQMDLFTGQIAGVEALVRWNHPGRGLLPADAFIPIAEKAGIIVALGQWVLDQACRQMRLWRDAGINPPTIAINLSVNQLKSGRKFVQDVMESLKKWDILPGDLSFDVTEGTLAQITWTRNDVLAQLRELGTKIAIADFGGEYSSFDYLRTFHVNHLKIAQSYIDKTTGNSDRSATMRAILNLAREIGVDVIAEGVETEEQRVLLANTGSVTQAQGFYFSEAVSADRTTAILKETTHSWETIGN